MADAPWKSEATRERAARAAWRAYSAPQAGDHDDDGWDGGAEHYEAFHRIADAVLGAVGQVLYDQGREDERERIADQQRAFLDRIVRDYGVGSHSDVAAAMLAEIDLVAVRDA